MSNKIFLDSDNLRLIVYVIGYPQMGESQVILLKDIISGNIYYSAVVDCYKLQDINKTIDILNENNIRSLNLLCWTHPDDDHSYGIDEIFKNFCNYKTKILLPEGIYGDPNDFVDYKPKYLDFFEDLKKNNSKAAYNVHSATVIEGEVQGVETIYFQRGINEIKFRISTIAPISAIVRRRIQAGLSTKNDISISLLFSLGELSLFLTGDIENQTINLIAREFLPEITFLKTPHHTSKSSDALLSVFERQYDFEYKIPFTCTTAFRKHKLPDDELIEGYRMFSNTFYTTHDDLSVEKFGYINFEFNPFDNTAKEKLSGSARRIY